MPAGIIETAIARVPSKGNSVSYSASATSGGSYTRILGLVSISGPDLDREDVDATELDPVDAATVTETDFWTTQMPGDKKAMPMVLTINMSVTLYNALFMAGGLFELDSLIWFKITFRNTDTLGPFRAYIKGATNRQESNQLVRVELTIQPINSARYVDTA